MRSQRGKNIAKTTGFGSVDEYNEVMFLREITHTINAFNDIEVILRNYSKDSNDAYMQLKRLMIQDE